MEGGFSWAHSRGLTAWEDFHTLANAYWQPFPVLDDPPVFPFLPHVTGSRIGTVSQTMSPVRLLIVGAGNRGQGYAAFAKSHPDLARIVGVAEPRPFWRESLAAGHGVPTENVFPDWRQLADRRKLADAVLICTQDDMHLEPVLAFAEKGYHILLEKPMAPNEADCCLIVEAARKNRILLGVCHVLRYTRYTQRIKRLLDDGAVGEIVSIQHLEPVGYWHYAHSYVRGNWRNESQSSPMLLAKSCHDLDWIRYLMAKRCVSVASFGSLRHFRAEEKPAGAGERCLDCGVEANCPYSAKRFYLGRVAKGMLGWPLHVVTHDRTAEGVREALRQGPYGRCVYACDNDVVDNQVVIMNFEDGSTANFTMTAFTPSLDRMTKIFGTRGYLSGDGSKIEHFDFLTEEKKVVDTEATEGSILGGHGGGDGGLMGAFVRAVAENDPSAILSGPEETLESHLMVFAAERARRENRVVSMGECACRLEDRGLGQKDRNWLDNEVSPCKLENTH